MNQPIEWRPIRGYEGAYEVSNSGRVRSLDRTIYRPSGPVRISGREMSLTPWGYGYLTVKLHSHGPAHTWHVHVLVAEAFLKGRLDGQEVRHFDGDCQNNHVENLRWGSQSDNMFDMVRHGRHHNAVKTHCPRGHPYDAENTYSPPSRPTARYCLACTRDRRGRSPKTC